MGMLFRVCQCCSKSIPEQEIVKEIQIKEGNTIINKLVCSKCYNTTHIKETLLVEG